jgi:uncharacterized membrane protein YgcG
MQALDRKMAPDTEHRSIVNRITLNGSRPVWTGLLRFLLWILLASVLCSGKILAQEKDIVLEASGIHYPGGYDPHTVGEVRGKVSRLTRPEKGPVRFLLVSDRETYTVLTSPDWYWNDSQIKNFEGQDVTVRGSKSLGKDGNLYIIAREIAIPASGKSIELRGADGTPLWKGGRSGWGSSGGGGSVSGTRGGLGGGFGGGGRGRR